MSGGVTKALQNSYSQMDRSQSLFQQHVHIERRFKPEAKVVLWHGDALQLLRTIPSETVSLVVSSPPYNVGKAYEVKAEIDELPGKPSANPR